MIDFTKINHLPVTPEKLLNNGLLTFPHSNVSTAGELLDRWQVAHYNTLTFKIKGENSKLLFSPHKHKQGGTNWQDFNLFDIQETIQELSETFEFDPEKANINFIEVGINIPLDEDPTKLINCFVIYRNTPFEKMRVTGKGYGKVAETENFDLKVYNKSLQYGLPFHLLRYEVKVKIMRYLKGYGITGLTLADLTRPDIYPIFKTMLLDLLSGILIYNPDIDPDKTENTNDRDLLKLGKFAGYWQQLDHRRKNEKLIRFSELAGTDKIKDILKGKISDKWELLSNPDKYTTFNNTIEPDKYTTFENEQNSFENDKIGQIHPTINSVYVRTCIVTCLPIRNQRLGTKYISAKGVKWYCENEPETYEKRLKPLLSDKWLILHCGDPMKIYFDEIYHQIRNRSLDPKHNFKRDYANLERKGLKLFPTLDLLPPDMLRLLKTEQ